MSQSLPFTPFQGGLFSPISTQASWPPASPNFSVRITHAWYHARLLCGLWDSNSGLRGSDPSPAFDTRQLHHPRMPACFPHLLEPPRSFSHSLSVFAEKQCVPHIVCLLCPSSPLLSSTTASTSHNLPQSGLHSCCTLYPRKTQTVCGAQTNSFTADSTVTTMETEGLFVTAAL